MTTTSRFLQETEMDRNNMAFLRREFCGGSGDYVPIGSGGFGEVFLIPQRNMVVKRFFTDREHVERMRRRRSATPAEERQEDNLSKRMLNLYGKNGIKSAEQEWKCLGRAHDALTAAGVPTAYTLRPLDMCQNARTKSYFIATYNVAENTLDHLIDTTVLSHPSFVEICLQLMLIVYHLLRAGIMHNDIYELNVCYRRNKSEERFQIPLSATETIAIAPEIIVFPIDYGMCTFRSQSTTNRSVMHNWNDLIELLHKLSVCQTIKDQFLPLLSMLKQDDVDERAHVDDEWFREKRAIIRKLFKYYKTIHRPAHS